MININVMSPLHNSEAKLLLNGAEFDVRYIGNDELHHDPAIIIAKTEEYGERCLKRYKELLAISRLGSGVDNIDLETCKKLNIKVLRTKAEPANAVAEFTIGQILTALRQTHKATWDYKPMGKELCECLVGVIGYGTIGKKIVEKLKTLGVGGCLINEIKYPKSSMPLKSIFKECDIITLHIPLKDWDIDNTNFITINELDQMKDNVILVNTSRGGIINEDDLYKWLVKHPDAQAIIDTFIGEPEQVDESLYRLPNVIGTPHMASMTKKARLEMEFKAVQNVVDFLKKHGNIP